MNIDLRARVALAAALCVAIRSMAEGPEKKRLKDMYYSLMFGANWSKIEERILKQLAD